MSKPMIVAGVMSGTSADGINVALVRIADSRPSAGRGKAHGRNRIQLIGQSEYRYPPKVRAAVLEAMNASRASVADLARLDSLLGVLYADAVLATQQRFRTKLDLVGCHGQTFYHQAVPQRFLGKQISTTWQTGEAAWIAARVGVPVVSDFRPADMAAGGKGAPLVPYLDYLWFRDERVGRIAQNIGGIANLTAIAAGAGSDRVLAFDTGPGNMVIDAVTQRLFKRAFDDEGRIAAAGKLIEPVLRRLLADPFFRAKPPKTAGREEFGRDFVREFLRLCGGARKQDVVATATALTARSIADAIDRFVLRKSEGSFQELIVSGGGLKNATLVAMLKENLAPSGVVVRFSDEFGLPSEAKEAIAFAVLAYET
jgi:anhydro-N-acetylmuramic acid kinase